MKCKTCNCELGKENPPAAALDFGSEDGEDLKYYCSSECLVNWIMTFAVVHYGIDNAMSMLSNSK